MKRNGGGQNEYKNFDEINERFVRYHINLHPGLNALDFVKSIFYSGGAVRSDIFEQLFII